MTRLLSKQAICQRSQSCGFAAAGGAGDKSKASRPLLKCRIQPLNNSLQMELFYRREFFRQDSDCCRKPLVFLIYIHTQTDVIYRESEIDGAVCLKYLCFFVIEKANDNFPIS